MEKHSSFYSVIFAAAGSLLFAGAASAGTVVLTFNQLGAIATSENTGIEPILNFYDGGYAGNGTASCGFTVCGPGPNYGITFESNSVVGTNKLQGGTANADQEPAGGINSLAFLTGTGDIMNVAGGFTTGFSFYYSAPNRPGSVTVWSGPDATGTELADLTLAETPNGKTYGSSCNPSYAYCPFVPFGVTFSGTAESVDFSGTENHIAFTDITLGSGTPGTSSTPPSTTPEPASVMLFCGGLAGIALIRRRRAA